MSATTTINWIGHPIWLTFFDSVSSTIPPSLYSCSFPTVHHSLTHQSKTHTLISATIHDKHRYTIPNSILHKTSTSLNKDPPNQLPFKKIRWWGIIKSAKVSKFGEAVSDRLRKIPTWISRRWTTWRHQSQKHREREKDTRKLCNRRNQHPNTWREGKLWKTLFDPIGEPNWRCFQTPLAAPPFYHGNSTPNMPVTWTTLRFQSWNNNNNKVGNRSVICIIGGN